MPCLGCKERRQIGHAIVHAYRVKDYDGVRSGLEEMGKSLGHDVQRFVPHMTLRQRPPPVADEEGRRLVPRIRPGHDKGGGRL